MTWAASIGLLFGNPWSNLLYEFLVPTSAFGETLAERIPDLRPRLAPFVEDGLLVPDGEDYRVTPLGRLFLRVIAMSFDAYLPEPDLERPMFSRTV